MHPDPDSIPYEAVTTSTFLLLSANTLCISPFYVGSKHRFLGFPQKSGAPPDPVCEKDVRLHVVLLFSIQLLRTPLEYIYRNSVDRTNRRINPGCILICIRDFNYSVVNLPEAFSLGFGSSFPAASISGQADYIWSDA